MKVFIKEYCRDVNIRIYGIDGEERTKEFFEKYFEETIGVYETTDEEHERFGSEAEFTIEKADDYNYFAGKISTIQQAIDDIADSIINGSEIDRYVDSVCYAI